LCNARKIQIKNLEFALDHTTCRRTSMTDCPLVAEADLKELFAKATAAAVTVHGAALERSEAWQRMLDIVGLLADAQSLLLNAERERCTELLSRRGRASTVRFACYDLSPLEPLPKKL